MSLLKGKSESLDRTDMKSLGSFLISVDRGMALMGFDIETSADVSSTFLSLTKDEEHEENNEDEALAKYLDTLDLASKVDWTKVKYPAIVKWCDIMASYFYYLQDQYALADLLEVDKQVYKLLYVGGKPRGYQIDEIENKEIHALMTQIVKLSNL